LQFTESSASLAWMIPLTQNASLITTNTHRLNALSWANKMIKEIL